MQEIVEQLFSYLRGIWRYRWYALILAWVTCIAGWAVVFKLPPVYQASARVYVDTQSVLRPLLDGLVVDVVDPNQEVDLMTRTLLSRPNLEKVMRMTDLDLQVRSSVEREDLLSELESSTDLRGTGQENLYTINYQDENPALAKKIVQSLLTIWIENTLGGSRSESNEASRFLDRQIAEYESRLLAAEERLKEFKRVNADLMMKDGSSYYDRMQQAALALEEASLQLRQAEQRRDSLRRQVVGEEPTFGLETLPPMIGDTGSDTNLGVENELSALPVQQRINALQQNLDNLLLKYTERHPDVIAAQEYVAKLEVQRDEQLAELRQKEIQVNAPGVQMPRNADPDTNPVYQQLKLSLANAEAQIAELQALVQQRQGDYEKLRDKVHRVPEIEAQLTALDRDYEVTRKNYDQLLTRREAAHITEQSRQTSEDIRFRVIDPPRVPPEPSGPNRPIFSSGVLMAGVGAGLGVAFLLSQLRPVFDSRQGLMAATNVPILGGVGIVLPRSAMRRQRLWVILYLLLGGMLLITFAAVIVWQVTGGINLPLASIPFL